MTTKNKTWKLIVTPAESGETGVSKKMVDGVQYFRWDDVWIAVIASTIEGKRRAFKLWLKFDLPFLIEGTKLSELKLRVPGEDGGDVPLKAAIRALHRHRCKEAGI